jgi:hypothetical protein
MVTVTPAILAAAAAAARFLAPRPGVTRRLPMMDAVDASMALARRFIADPSAISLKEIHAAEYACLEAGRIALRVSEKATGGPGFRNPNGAGNVAVDSEIAAGLVQALCRAIAHLFEVEEAAAALAARLAPYPAATQQKWVLLDCNENDVVHACPRLVRGYGADQDGAPGSMQVVAVRAWCRPGYTIETVDQECGVEILAYEEEVKGEMFLAVTVATAAGWFIDIATSKDGVVVWTDRMTPAGTVRTMAE